MAHRNACSCQATKVPRQREYKWSIKYGSGRGWSGRVLAKNECEATCKAIDDLRRRIGRHDPSKLRCFKVQLA
jgi:hypothetical protein